VNDRGSNGTGISGIEVRPDTVKLTNVIVVINCFWSFSSCNNRHVVSTALWELIWISVWSGCCDLKHCDDIKFAVQAKVKLRWSVDCCARWFCVVCDYRRKQTRRGLVRPTNVPTSCWKSRLEYVYECRWLPACGVSIYAVVVTVESQMYAMHCCATGQFRQGFHAVNLLPGFPSVTEIFHNSWAVFCDFIVITSQLSCGSCLFTIGTFKHYVMASTYYILHSWQCCRLVTTCASMRLANVCTVTVIIIVIIITTQT